MRRQGQYGDPGAANAYVGAAQVQHVSAQRTENRSESDHFRGRLEAFTPERDHPYAASKVEAQWRWETDESKMSHPMAPRIFSEGQVANASRSYFQGKGPGQEAKLTLEKQVVTDPRLGMQDDNMQIGFEEKPLLQSLEVVEQKFHDDILKLSKEHNDAEDAENARHRERLNAINMQYQEQLAALRARHAGRREDFLRKESQARQHQYQQSITDHFPNSGIGAGDPHGYSATAPASVLNEAHRAYSTDQFESYGERGRSLGGFRDQGFEPRGPYHGGRAYDAGTRYY